MRETTVKAETTKKSHVFITYILYYPLANDATYKMVNHTIGLTVVVEKDSAGKDVRPIAALLHYQQSNEIHQMRVFAVKDANFEPSAAVDKIYDAVSDFFVNGTTFELFVPAKLHAACSWSEKVSGVGESCQQPSTSNGIVELTLADPGVQPNELNTTNLKFDGTDTSTYGLKSFLNEVWPRRVDEGDGKVFNSNGSYTAPPTRPGTGVKRSVTFTGNTSVGNLGRTPMGWREMGNGLGDNDLAGWDGFIGVYFFDPAFLLTARLLTSDEAMLWAVDYCFNAYLAIEDRGNYTDCPTQ